CRFALSASRAGRGRLLAHPGQSGDASAGRGGVSRRRQAPALAAQQAAPGDPRQAAQTATGRTRGAVAGRGIPSVPAADPQLEPAYQELLLFSDDSATPTVPSGGDLSGIQMEMASRTTIQRVEIL